MDLLQLLQLGLVVVDGLLLGLINLGVQVVVVCCLDLGHLDQDEDLAEDEAEGKPVRVGVAEVDEREQTGQEHLNHALDHYGVAEDLEKVAALGLPLGLNDVGDEEQAVVAAVLVLDLSE